jgi:galactokinase
MDLNTLFQNHFAVKPMIKACAPGRVNLLGEHVDYNGGPVLPAAIDRAINLIAAPLQEPIARLYAQDLGEAAAFRLDQLEAKIDLDGKPLPKWAHYPAGVAWALKAAGLPTPGLEAVYRSDIPIGSGLSSSAAVETVFAVTWEALGGWQIDRMHMARLCQQAENGYVGVNCGLMDQFARPTRGRNARTSTRAAGREAVPCRRVLPGDRDSGVRSSPSAYNGAGSLRTGCQLLKQYPSIQPADVSPVNSPRRISSPKFAGGRTLVGIGSGG